MARHLDPYVIAVIWQLSTLYSVLCTPYSVLRSIDQDGLCPVLHVGLNLNSTCGFIMTHMRAISPSLIAMENTAVHLVEQAGKSKVEAAGPKPTQPKG